MPHISVLIADNHALFQQGLSMLLAKTDDILVIGKAVDGPQTVSLLQTLQPDILLLDLQISGLGGIEGLSLIRKKSPRTRVLILCELPDDELMVQALQLGAKGCLSKTLSQEDLTRAIRATYNGEIWAERKVVTRALEGLRRKVHGVSASLEKTQDILTAREQEVVKWAIRGMTNKEIAAHLGISDKTVKTHLGSVFNKLKISRRSELIRRGMVE